MTVSAPIQPSRGLQILKIVLYILAGLILAAGLIAGISVMVSTDRVVQSLLMPLQLMGNQAVTNMIAPMITAFLFNLGLILLILAAIFSALLYGLGRLLGHVSILEARLARLEGKT